MSGYDAVYATFVELAQDGLCDCSAGRRLCTASELVYEHERL